jgi:hypothetical protein
VLCTAGAMQRPQLPASGALRAEPQQMQRKIKRAGSFYGDVSMRKEGCKLPGDKEGCMIAIG